LRGPPTSWAPITSGSARTCARTSPTASSSGCAWGAGPRPSITAKAAPPPPDWFRDNRDFGRIADGLRATGLSSAETDAIMGGNWLRFFDTGFGPQMPATQPTDQQTDRAAE